MWTNKSNVIVINDESFYTIDFLNQKISENEWFLVSRVIPTSFRASLPIQYIVNSRIVYLLIEFDANQVDIIHFTESSYVLWSLQRVEKQKLGFQYVSFNW